MCTCMHACMQTCDGHVLHTVETSCRGGSDEYPHATHLGTRHAGTCGSKPDSAERAGRLPCVPAGVRPDGLGQDAHNARLRRGYVHHWNSPSTSEGRHRTASQPNMNGHVCTHVCSHAMGMCHRTPPESSRPWGLGGYNHNVPIQVGLAVPLAMATTSKYDLQTVQGIVFRGKKKVPTVPNRV